MTTIKEIIEKINKLESEFNIFNSRILEFAKSTNNSKIDAELLKKYISNLKHYRELGKKYKFEVENNIKSNDKEEYRSQKSIVSFRLENLDKIFQNSIKKLDIINDSISTNNKKNSRFDVDFRSAKEMFEINNVLYDFYNNYNINLEYQQKYNISIKLDNNFEIKQEKKLKSFNLVKKENKYIEDLNQIFEELEELNIKFYNEFKRLTKYEDIIFLDLDKLYNYYFPENGIHFIFRIFRDKLSDSYINDNFNISKSDIYIDFRKFKRIINKELKYIDFLVRFNDFANNYNNFKIIDKEYNIFSNFDIFEELLNNFKKINNKNYGNVLDIIKYINSNFYIDKNKSNGLLTTTICIEMFEKSYDIIKIYDTICKNKSSNLDFGFFNNLLSFITSSEQVGHRYILQGLNNIKKNIILELHIGNYSTKGELLTKLKKINNQLGKYLIRLKNIDKKIEEIEKFIRSINYRVGYGVTRYINNGKKLITSLNSYFGFSSDSPLVLPLVRYINSIIKYEYTVSKQTYTRRQSTSSYISSSSSYSSSSSSSSSWSSSSSSFGSSYSSSGGSSW